MPNFCCVPFCNQPGGFKFPADAKLREQWRMAIKRDQWTPTSYSVVCPSHFNPEDFRGPETCDGIPRSLRRLIKTAVPSNFRWTKPETLLAEDRRQHARQGDQRGSQKPKGLNLHVELLQDEFIQEIELPWKAADKNAEPTDPEMDHLNLPFVLPAFASHQAASVILHDYVGQVDMTSVPLTALTQLVQTEQPDTRDGSQQTEVLMRWLVEDVGVGETCSSARETLDDTGSLDMTCDDDGISVDSSRDKVTNTALHVSTGTQTVLKGIQTDLRISPAAQKILKGVQTDLRISPAAQKILEGVQTTPKVSPGHPHLSPQPATGAGQCTLAEMHTRSLGTQVSSGRHPLPLLVETEQKQMDRRHPLPLLVGTEQKQMEVSSRNSPSLLTLATEGQRLKQVFAYQLCGQHLYSRTHLMGNCMTIPEEFLCFACPVCGEGFFGHREVRVKELGENSSPLPLLKQDPDSPRCGETDSRVVAWGCHPLYICTACKGCFFSKVELVVHREGTVHKYFACRFCDSTLSSALEMVLHWQDEHSSSRDRLQTKFYKCALCDYIHTKMSSYKNHVRRHLQDRPLLCEHCGKMFKREQSLVNHCKVHEGERSLECHT